MHLKRMASTLVCCIALSSAASLAQSPCSRGVEVTNTDAATFGWVRIADDPSLEPQELTLEAWIIPTGTGYGRTTTSGGAMVIGKPWEGAAGTFLVSYGIQWEPLTEKIVAVISHAMTGQGTPLLSNGTAPLNSATHVAITFDGATLRIFLNGMLDNEVAAADSNVDYGDQDVLIGAANYAGSYHRRFQGIVDEVRLWDHARDQATIAANMSATSHRPEPGLLAAYSFNGLDAMDVSGNDNHGTPEGTASFVQMTDLPNLVHCDGLETGDTTRWSFDTTQP